MKKRLLYPETGFTLIEVIVVMAVIGVVTVIALPNVKDFMQNSTTKAVSRELYGQFQRAKMEAIKRNQNVVIAFSTAGTHQYQMYVDNDGDRVMDAGEQLLTTVILPDFNEFGVNEFAGASAGFNPRGRPYGGTGSVVVVNTETARTFKLTTSIAGYIHLQ